MRRFIWLVFLPAGLAAQRPAVSPVLPRLLSRVKDTTISVGLFARPTASLDAISERAAAVGARVRVRSSWLHAVSADVPAAALRQLLQDRDLRRVQPLGRFKLRGERPSLIPGIITAPAQGPGDTCGVTPGDDPVLGPSEMPYRLLHLRPLTDQGIDATGVRIALLDTGFDTSNPAFNGITITAQFDFVFHDDTVKDQPGKDVAAAQRGILVVPAAANDGPASRSIETPADGDSVLAIGAEDSSGVIAPFSSRGPTADGRIKPDFTAPGVAVCVLTGVGKVGRGNGTSFATPLLAASAALVKQLHPALLPMDLRAAFRSTATKRAAPDTIYGWGRPDVAAAAVFPSGVTATAPLPGAGALTTISPAFAWTVGTVPPSATPVTYRLRVSRDSTLASPTVDTTLTGEAAAPARAFKSGSIFWRVDARAASGETASTGRIGPGVRSEERRVGEEG